jgi:hypothetical protein
VSKPNPINKVTDTFYKVIDAVNYILENGVDGSSGVPSVSSGTLATRPPASSEGALYVATDDNKIYQFRQSSWVTVGGSDTLDWSKITGVPTASSTQNGVLTKEDWSKFNTPIPTASASQNGVLTKEDWSKFNSKEDAAKKGTAGGYAGLDSNAKVPVSQLPSLDFNKTSVVSTMAARDALTGMKAGDRAIVLDAGDTSREGFVWDGTEWLKDSDTDWANVLLEWANLSGKPSSTVEDLDGSVTHSKITSGNPHGTTATDVGAYTKAEVNGLLPVDATTSQKGIVRMSTDYKSTSSTTVPASRALSDLYNISLVDRGNIFLDNFNFALGDGIYRVDKTSLDPATNNSPVGAYPKGLLFVSGSTSGASAAYRQTYVEDTGIAYTRTRPDTGIWTNWQTGITGDMVASLTQAGIVQLTSDINSTSETLAATAKGLKTAYDLANSAYRSRGNVPLDWNSATLSGDYNVSLANWTGYSNYPAGAYNYGVLVVDIITGGACQQTYYTHDNPGRVFQRISYGGANWRPWTEVLTTSSGVIPNDLTISGTEKALVIKNPAAPSGIRFQAGADGAFYLQKANLTTGQTMGNLIWVGLDGNLSWPGGDLNGLKQLGDSAKAGAVASLLAMGVPTATTADDWATVNAKIRKINRVYLWESPLITWAASETKTVTAPSDMFACYSMSAGNTSVLASTYWSNGTWKDTNSNTNTTTTRFEVNSQFAGNGGTNPPSITLTNRQAAQVQTKVTFVGMYG